MPAALNRNFNMVRCGDMPLRSFMTPDHGGANNYQGNQNGGNCNET